MLEALILAGGLGFLLGLRYRVTAVVPASAAVAALTSGIGYLGGIELWLVVLAAFGSVVVLQVGYLGGLLLSFFTASRANPDHDHDLRSTERYWADAKD
jgi:hypothetical protein